MSDDKFTGEMTAEVKDVIKSLTKNIKTQEGLSQLTTAIRKQFIESVLGAELDVHLGYPKNRKSESRRENARNGTSPKTVYSDHGEIEIAVPQDRAGEFEEYRKN